MKKERKSRAIYLSTELYDRIKERAETTGFGSVEEYVSFVLMEVLKEDSGEGEKLTIDSEQEEEVKKRLRALGYLD